MVFERVNGHRQACNALLDPSDDRSEERVPSNKLCKVFVPKTFAHRAFSAHHEHAGVRMQLCPSQRSRAVCEFPCRLVVQQTLHSSLSVQAVEERAASNGHTLHAEAMPPENAVRLHHLIHVEIDFAFPRLPSLR
eukprot:CAMPEP_0114525714 /NCGR_PEP_ID=MMETSP0109-20121206/22592_1 /TAXON_ID=29199 /ORGANISM="Chlorarachnion reptans, Strain CCCM449" /LENGTH=134 /DNA_ID=CAMNT_0001707355 /DNA_START=301 /DNA_END=706 /DNA_ORIENTATION=-